MRKTFPGCCARTTSGHPCTAKKRDELAPLHVCPQGSGNGIVGSNENIDQAETRLRHSNMKCWPMSGPVNCVSDVD